MTYDSRHASFYSELSAVNRDLYRYLQGNKTLPLITDDNVDDYAYTMVCWMLMPSDDEKHLLFPFPEPLIAFALIQTHREVYQIDGSFTYHVVPFHHLQIPSALSAVTPASWLIQFATEELFDVSV